VAVEFLTPLDMSRFLRSVHPQANPVP
jgi:hypothetical protein